MNQIDIFITISQQVYSRVFPDSDRKLSGMTTEEKISSLFPVQVLLSNQISQWSATFCSHSSCLNFFFAIRSVWSILDLLLAYAKCFRFMIKLWDFVRVFLSTFLLKILRETPLEITKTLTSVDFWAYLFSLHFAYFILIQLCRRTRS